MSSAAVSPALGRLRAEARARALFPPSTLAGAVARMGFVQADPIRAPARAQDLILRHRVRGYRVGDLDRGFARLGLEEDFLHAYGFMPRGIRDLLHPRLDAAGAHLPEGLAAEVLAFVRARKLTHPRDLEARFGSERTTNNWGGFSKATTRALESLHRFGLLRVARRRDGIRIYAAAAPAVAVPDDPAGRARQLVLLVATNLAPVPASGLRAALSLLSHRNKGLGPMAPVVQDLLRTGELWREEIDGETYLRPTTPAPETAASRDVRLLAPFDPLVWDRRRFEHLWGWRYRFEAYTPPAKRQMGYYAMPLLWGDAVIGWGNVAVIGGQLHATFGFVGREPGNQVFRRGLDAEMARLGRFLGLPGAAAARAASPAGS